MNQNIENTTKVINVGKHIVDTAIGAGGVSVVVWWQYVQGIGGAFMLIGGAVLLYFRILIAIEELRIKRATGKDGDE